MPEDTALRRQEPSTAQATDALNIDEIVPAPLHRIGWGQLTRKPSGFDQVGEGPNAVAVAPDGATLLLDRLGGRILRVEEDGAARALAAVDEDVEDMAVGPDGAIVAYSPLRAKAWVFEPNGQPVGEIDIPRSFREVVAIGLDGSRVVRLHTMHQETLVVGSPSAPLELPIAMRTKKEGAFQLADGRGVATRAEDGKVELIVLQQPTAETRTAVLARHAVPGVVKAARIVGIDGTVACMRTEQVSSGPRISVSRRAVCMDVTTGAVTLDRALPARGAYLPRRELAVGAGTLVFIHPTAEGLGVYRWSTSGKDAEEGTR